ncbi:MAG: hypothetical protein JNM63_04285, partial [Spirochaetia bacterium]|nr:hypothetical protein [Spirochaetia bacterium]
MTKLKIKPERIFRPFTQKDLKHWLFLSGKLWPDESVKDMKALFPILLSPRKYFFRACVVNGAWVGFIYVGIRRDYVEGSSRSPVGYLEGIYILPKFRR